MKKVSGFLFATAIIFSLAPTTLAVGNFPDVKGTWCESYVSSLVEKRIVNGMEDGNYHPNDQVTRGAVSKLLVTAMQYSSSSITTDTKNNPLPDTAGKWSEQYIVPLCQAGIIVPAEYTKGFVENQAMSRLETIKTIVRTYLHAHPETSLPTGATLSFTDKAQIAATDVPYVAMGVELGIINGIPVDGGVAFKPYDGILRSEASAMISRFLDKCGKFSDHLGTSENRVDGSVPTANQVSNLPQIKAANGQNVEWVLAPTIQLKDVTTKFTEFSEDGLCSYVDASGKQIFVDRSGKTYSFSNVANESVDLFVNGLASAKDITSGKYGFIDFNGKFVISPQYYCAYEFSKCYFKDGSEGYWAYVFFDPSATDDGYIDITGKFMTSEAFTQALDGPKSRGEMAAPTTSEPGCKVNKSRHTSSGLFVISKNITVEHGPATALYGIVDSHGKTLLAPTSNRYISADVYDDCIILSHPIGANWDVAKQDIYNNQGNFVTTVYGGSMKAFNNHSPYRSIRHYGEGLFVVADRPEGKRGFMKMDGSFLIPCVFDRAQPFNQGLAWVQYNGLWGLIKMPSK